MWRLTSSAAGVLRFSARPRASACLHGLPPPKDEYSEVAEYPSLPTHRTQFEKESAKLANFIQGLRTVEERLWYLNKPKHFGWHSIVMDAEKVPYGARDFLQCVTRTHVVEGLPERYREEALDSRARQLADLVAPRLERAMRDQELEETEQDVANDKISMHEV